MYNFPEDVRTMKRRIARFTTKVSARLRRTTIKAIRAQKAAARSAVAAQVYGPVVEKAAAKRRRIVHATRRLAM